MTKVIIVGEVINEVKLLKRSEKDLFLSLLIKEGNEMIRVYANNEVAVHVADTIKIGMIVYIEARLKYAKYTKYNDTFNLIMINIWNMWEKKPQFIELKSKRSGLNGKPLPF